MAGLGIRLFTDEMINPSLAPELRRRGYDVESCDEAGRSQRRISDADQLEYATGQGRAILSFNKRDFIALDRSYKGGVRRHAGIIVAPQIDDLGVLLRAVQRHLDTVEPEMQADTLLWLALNPGD
jgi:hypothetical protein